MNLIYEFVRMKLLRMKRTYLLHISLALLAAGEDLTHFSGFP